MSENFTLEIENFEPEEILPQLTNDIKSNFKIDFSTNTDKILLLNQIIRQLYQEIVQVKLENKNIKKFLGL